MTDSMTSATVEVRKDWGRDLPGHHSDAFKKGYNEARGEAKRNRYSAEEAHGMAGAAHTMSVAGDPNDKDGQDYYAGRREGFAAHAAKHTVTKTPGPTKFAKGASHAAGHKGTKIGAMVKNDDKYTWGREMSSATVHVRKDWGRDLHRYAVAAASNHGYQLGGRMHGSFVKGYKEGLIHAKYSMTPAVAHQSGRKVAKDAQYIENASERAYMQGRASGYLTHSAGSLASMPASEVAAQAKLLKP